MSRDVGNMSIELYRRIIKQISEYQNYVALHHFGESLVYKELPEAVMIAREHGVETGLSCNPPNLHPALGARLLDAGISNLVLSLDSLDASVYQDIRGKAARFDRADTNIREFLRLRNQKEIPVSVTLQMINLDCNQEEADEFLNYCQEVGVDRGVVIRLGRWDFDDAFLEELGEYSSPGYDGYCSRPSESVVVLWDGRVVPCCHDYDGEIVLGDLKKSELEEIWNSVSARSFRNSGFDNSLCQKCAFNRSFRENQRSQNGFRSFHRYRDHTRSRKEWINPNSLTLLSRKSFFDGFDILNE